MCILTLMWSNEMPTLLLKSLLKRGILAYRWLKWFNTMNSAFIFIPMPIAWDVVLEKVSDSKSDHLTIMQLLQKRLMHWIWASTSIYTINDIRKVCMDTTGVLYCSITLFSTANSHVYKAWNTNLWISADKAKPNLHWLGWHSPPSQAINSSLKPKWIPHKISNQFHSEVLRVIQLFNWKKPQRDTRSSSSRDPALQNSNRR